MKGYLHGNDYAKLIEAAPVLCVDIDLQTLDGRHIVFKRNNEPAKGEWWVLGGRMMKGEKAQDAILRKIKEEAGLDEDDLVSTLDFIGFYEEVFEFSSLGRGKYHTVSLVFEVIIKDPNKIKLDSQHSEWSLMSRIPHAFNIQRTKCE